jgi:hypothetical protein
MPRFNILHCIMSLKYPQTVAEILEHMNETSSPKKKGRRVKYATQEEYRAAKTAQRREQRRRQQCLKDNVDIEHTSPSM